jgi:type I restriction enzyme, S subunit
VTTTSAPIKHFTLGIFDGPHATPRPSEEGPIFLGIKNVTEDGRLDFSEIRHVSENEFEKWTRRVTPQNDDIVFSYEATLHRYARIPDGFLGCLGRRMALVRPDTQKIDPRFLHYYFLSPIWRAKMDAITITGATVNRLPLTTFPEVKVDFPGLNEQRAIAENLSAYDDLIENNRRRIALLEEAARMLYREWFIHFRFPGHEHVRIIDGLPEGWQSWVLRNCASFESGGTPSKSRPEYWSGDIPWISSGELTRMRIAEATHNVTAAAVEVGSRYAERDTILAVVRGMSLAKEFRIGIATRQVCFNQDLKAIVPDRGIEGLFLFHALDEKKGRIRQMAGEASHGTKKLESAVLENLPITVPPSGIRRHFLDYVEPIHSQWDVLFQQNQKLEAARDLLLPRLMNGEVAV